MLVRTAVASVLSLMLSQASTHAQTARVESAGPKRTELRNPTVSVPMDNWGGRPVVLARINGKGPFRLLLDTGTGHAAVLDDDLVKKLKIPIAGKTPIPGTLGEGGLIGVESITIGGAEFSDVSATRTDFSRFTLPGPKMPDGILGLPLFEECLLTLDYPGRKVVFESGELPPDGESIEYSPHRQRDFGVTIELSVAGTAVKAHVDTGSPAFVALLTNMQDNFRSRANRGLSVGPARRTENPRSDQPRSTAS